MFYTVDSLVQIKASISPIQIFSVVYISIKGDFYNILLN